MKKSIIAGLIVLVLIGATSVWPRKATAQGPHRIQTWTVVLTGNYHYNYGSSEPDGIVVEQVSASATAPQITNGQSIAGALNVLRESGGQVMIHPGYFLYTITGPN